MSNTVSVPANIKKLSLRIDNNGGGTIWYDDVIVRRVTAPASKIVEESNYYPFGMKQEGYNNVPRTDHNLAAQRYKYNSKEYQDELNLNWYNYGWRNYDPALARWVTIDPLLNDLDFAFDDKDVDEDDDDEVFWALVTKLETGDGVFNVDNLNPYGYGYNNPVNFDDPDGRCPACWIFAFLLASEPAMAPTKNHASNIRAFTSARNDKAIMLASAVPVSATTRVLGNVIRTGSRAQSQLKNPQKAKAVEKGIKSEKTYQTYTKKNGKSGEVYSGRTSGKDTPIKNIEKRDVNHHKNKDGFGPAKIDKSSTSKDAIRGREQQLINKNGGAKSTGGSSGNSINGVSPKNPKAQIYNDAANKEFGP